MTKSAGRILRWVVILAVVAVVWRWMLPLGLAWRHYSTAPSFREWAGAHAAGDELWRPALIHGEVVAEAVPWRSQAGEPSTRAGTWEPRVEIRHGEELLLDATFEVRVETREFEGWKEKGSSSEDFLGFEISVKSRTLDPDFHAVAVFSIRGIERPADAGPGPRKAPALQLDVVALSGPGDLHVIVQDCPDANLPSGAEIGRSISMKRFALGRTLLPLVHPTDDPPEEGLAYHVRTTFYPSWTLTDGGASGAGFGVDHFRVSSEQYSVSLRLEENETPPFKGGKTSTSAESRLKFTWSDEIW